MRSKRPLLYSVIVSVLAHMLFFASATGVKITSVYDTFIKTQRFFNIKNIPDYTPARKSSGKSRELTDIRDLRFESPVDSPQVHAQGQKERYAPKAKLSPAKAEKIQPVAASQNYLLKTKKHDVALKKTGIRHTRKGLVKMTPQSSWDHAPVKLGDFSGTQASSEEFFDKMPGFTPREIDRTIDSGKGKDVYTSAHKLTPGVRRKTNFEDLEENLTGEVLVYQDPKDGQKYYKIGIRAGQGALALPRLAKEIVFLVDCSYSIREKRLEEFKKGLQYWLTHLNAEDHFNVIAFKETIEKFRPVSVKPTKENIKEALHFIGKLTAGKKTDTYSALYESIQLEERILPSYIVLFSDGLPTQGMRSSKKIINEISKLNKAKVSIFTFSGGVWVNRYLLDFIAYKNRGWSEYAHRVNLIQKQMIAMYKKIEDPLLMNLRYHVSGIGDQEIFPKLLPDFFRNTEFTLFGRYTNEDEFSIQLLGDLGDLKGKTKEFMIVRSLKNAFQGDQEIARHWAFNKIYHLIGLIEHGQGNESIIQEIDFLCKRFKIKIPYTRSFKK